MSGKRRDGRPTLTAVAALVAATFSGVIASSARAAPDDRERARAHLAEGAKLLEAGRPAQALARFEEAYAVFPSPKIRYNLGLAYRRLDRHAEAFSAFNSFLREANDGSAEHLNHARQELERLSRRVALARLDCDVAGAEVVLDGRRIGLTPVVDRLPVDTGPHELLVRGSGFASQSRRFTAIAGQAVDLRIDVGVPTADGPASLRSPTPRDVTRMAEGPPVSFYSGDSERTKADSSWKRVAGYGLLAAGVAGIVGGGYLLLRKQDDGCGGEVRPGFVCNTRSEGAVPGWVLLGTGAGLVVGGGMFLYVSRDIRVAMTIGPGAISLKGWL